MRRPNTAMEPSPRPEIVMSESAEILEGITDENRTKFINSFIANIGGCGEISDDAWFDAYTRFDTRHEKMRYLNLVRIELATPEDVRAGRAEFETTFVDDKGQRFDAQYCHASMKDEVQSGIVFLDRGQIWFYGAEIEARRNFMAEDLDGEMARMDDYSCNVTGEILHFMGDIFAPLLGTYDKNYRLQPVPVVKEPKVARHLTIGLPSGELVIADWFSIPGFTEAMDLLSGEANEHFDIYTGKGLDDRQRAYFEKAGIVIVQVGNTSPAAYEDTPGVFRMGHVYEDDDRFWHEDDSRTEADMPEAIFRTCNDLWANTFADRARVVDVLMFSGLYNEREDAERALTNYIDVACRAHSVKIDAQELHLYLPTAPAYKTKIFENTFRVVGLEYGDWRRDHYLISTRPLEVDPALLEPCDWKEGGPDGSRRSYVRDRLRDGGRRCPRTLAPTEQTHAKKASIMCVYMVEVPNLSQNTRYPVRADSVVEAADLYIQAYLSGQFVIFNHQVLSAAGKLETSAMLQDEMLESEQPGVIFYDEPEALSVALEDLPSWRAAIDAGYVPGTDPSDWRKGDENALEPEDSLRHEKIGIAWLIRHLGDVAAPEKDDLDEDFEP